MRLYGRYLGSIVLAANTALVGCSSGSDDGPAEISDTAAAMSVESGAEQAPAPEQAPEPAPEQAPEQAPDASAIGLDRILPSAIDLSNIASGEGKLISLNPGFQTLGDVNGDGNDDLLLRQSDPDFGFGFSVVFGSDDPSTLPANPTEQDLENFNGFLIEDSANLRLVGQSGAVPSDINGDGFTDIVIGSPGATANQSERAGKMYVIYGSDTPFPKRLSVNDLDGSNGFTINGFDPLQSVGESFAWAGDQNGDGFDELAIATNNPADTDIYIIDGQSTPFPADVELSQIDQYGTRYQVEQTDDGSIQANNLTFTAGDFNSDGWFDLGLRYTFVDRSDSQEVLAQRFDVYFGRADVGVSLGVLNEVPEMSLGYRIDNVAAVNVLGDLNADSQTDFELQYDTVFDTERTVLLGSDQLVLSGIVPVEEIPEGNQLTVSTSIALLFPIGDFNSDGMADLLLDPENFDDENFSTLPLYAVTDLTLPVEFDDDSNLLSDPANTRIASVQDIEGESIEGLFGASPVGDINGDGNEDWVLSMSTGNSAVNPTILLFGY